MKKIQFILLCLLSCALAASCAAEEAAPLPARLREEFLPEPIAAELVLGEGGELLDWCAGDPNGDGIEDVAVILERNETDGSGGREGKVCELLLFLGNGSGYVPGQSSRTFLTRGEESYPHTALSRLSIENGRLHVYEPIKKCERAADFSWQGDGLALTNFYWGEWYGNGTREYYDLTNGTYSMYSSWADNDGNPLPSKLLFQTVLDLPAPWRLEDVPSMAEAGEILAGRKPPLPSLGGNFYRPDLDSSGVLRRTPEEVLEQVRDTYYPDMRRVDIPWTEEARANFSSLAGYPVPGYYYTDGESVLWYGYLEFTWSDGGTLFLDHHILCEGGETTRYYQIKDASGEIETY